MQILINFWQKIVQIFTNLPLYVLLIELVLFSAIFYYMFRIAKKGGVIWLNFIIIIITIFVVLLGRKDYYLLICIACLFFSMIVLFQVEVRQDLFGSGMFKIENKYSNKNKAIMHEEEVQIFIAEIIKALFNLSKQNVGALIILSNDNVPQIIIDSGVFLDAKITSQLIESIFNPKAPLHDGAMVINNGKIQSAGCFLQLSRDTSIPKELGTRHRAGIGITETSNVTSLIVSEETGVITIVQHGKMQRYADHAMLQKTLQDYFWKELSR